MLSKGSKTFFSRNSAFFDLLGNGQVYPKNVSWSGSRLMVNFGLTLKKIAHFALFDLYFQRYLHLRTRYQPRFVRMVTGPTHAGNGR